VVEIASAYHIALGLPEDVGVWASTTLTGYDQLRVKVALLSRRFPPIAESLAVRYPCVICDEHQDADEAQHEIVMALHRAGARLRVFGDPFQRIYGRATRAVTKANAKQWEDLVSIADRTGALDEPHRWTRAGSGELGTWVQQARALLRSGGQLDLRGPRPSGLRVLFADNLASDRRGLLFETREAKPIRDLIQAAPELLVLAGNNTTVDAIRSFMGRSIPIWEGHVRKHLSKLALACHNKRGDAVAIATALLEFTSDGDDAGGDDVTVVTGFSRSKFGDRLVEEVRSGCVRRCHGVPARLQELARLLIAQPDQRGVAAVLERLSRLSAEDPAFSGVHIDLGREYRDAIRLRDFEDPVLGVSELSQQRSSSRVALPRKAVSTIHKAKGLEVAHVLVLPCDARHFSNSENARSKLYVAISRATTTLTLVLSRRDPSPLVAA
jgi:DNA helicase-2/ATP-dependent DNA helicase PcrA